MKPVCPRCRCFFRPKRNGTYLVEGMPRAGRADAPRGERDPGAWQPYKLWVGDLWECPDCGSEVIVGFASRPVAERHEENFAELVERSGAELQVNDC